MKLNKPIETLSHELKMAENLLRQQEDYKARLTNELLINASQKIIDEYKSDIKQFEHALTILKNQI